jgi:hypothetical protein
VKAVLLQVCYKVICGVFVVTDFKDVYFVFIFNSEEKKLAEHLMSMDKHIKKADFVVAFKQKLAEEIAKQLENEPVSNEDEDNISITPSTHNRRKGLFGIFSNYDSSDENNDDADDEETSNSTLSVADEILKFKGLLDAGVLTQEEFDKKKAQLLNL